MNKKEKLVTSFEDEDFEFSSLPSDNLNNGRVIKSSKTITTTTTKTERSIRIQVGDKAIEYHYTDEENSETKDFDNY